MKYSAYNKYQVSRLDPSITIPTDWQEKRLKYIASHNDETLSEKTDPDYEIEYVDISSVNIVNGITQTETLSFESAPSRARRIVKDGDSIVSTVRTYLKAIATIRKPPKNMVVSTGFAVIRPEEEICKNYLSYFLQSQGFVDSVVAHSVGVSYPAINASDLVCLPVSFPTSVNEQQKIADFLDYKTQQIDKLIEKKKALIEKLSEQRIAVITQAVTKGLDKNAKMKPSGVDWLGDVPEHWSVRRIKFSFIDKAGAIKTGPFGSQLKSEEMRGSDYKVYNQRNVIQQNLSLGDEYIDEEKYNDLSAFKVFDHDLLVTTRGTIGKCMQIPPNSEKGILHPCLMRLQFKDEVLVNEYFVYLLQESGLLLADLMLSSNATTLEVIYSDTLKNITAPLPPVNEQWEIAKYLKKELGCMDAMLAKVNAVIERLKEYRSAIIADAVTGKIDVRSEKISTEEDAA